MARRKRQAYYALLLRQVEAAMELLGVFVHGHGKKHGAEPAKAKAAA